MARFKDVPIARMAVFLNLKVLLLPAPSGMSDLQKDSRTGLIALSVLVGLVLLIACANVANLMTARGAAREREMALRVSIGAGRSRLVQLVLVESAWITLLASIAGGLFAWWSAPFVVGLINPPDNPARLVLTTDWRVAGFGFLLCFLVTVLFGLFPALRASAIKPASALKGGDDPHSRHRVMHALVAAQVAFCFVVQLVGGLFIATYDRLAHQSNGFSSDRLLTLETVTAQPREASYWDQVASHLRTIPGVVSAAYCDRPLLDGNAWNGFIWVNGSLVNDTLAYFRSVSAGWVDEMKISFIDGRDFLRSEKDQNVAIVSELFAKQYFAGANPVGKTFERPEGNGTRTAYRVVGLVKDARYRSARTPILPVAFFPFRSGAIGTLIVRTSVQDPYQLGPAMRKAVPAARSEFRVRNIRTQEEINQAHTVRERLLAMLALFFSVVALVLSGVGLYGVLDYSVLQRSREIGIRRALGAQASDVVRRVVRDVVTMVFAGAIAGLGLGLMSERYIETLLYGVKVTESQMLALPALLIVVAALVASMPAVVRALRVDPARMLRSD